MNCLVRINVHDFLEQSADFNLDPKFLAQFANQALLKCFARLTLAAGEFPKPAKMRRRRGVE